jgi:REP element-mobilizing transposase RayT
MARQLRHHYAGGWYHITARGMRRREIFKDDCDREHFIELLEGMVGRYGVILHAFVLMDNHYHLLLDLLSRLRWVCPQAGVADL